MATNTTNYGLTKPAYSDTADIADINGNMDTIDSEMKKISQDIAIVEFGDSATQAISNGSYVVWKGDLYKANQAISSGASLSGKLTSVSGGGLNDVYSSLNSNISNYLTSTNYNNVTSFSDLDQYTEPGNIMRYFAISNGQNVGNVTGWCNIVISKHANGSIQQVIISDKDIIKRTKTTSWGTPLSLINSNIIPAPTAISLSDGANSLYLPVFRTAGTGIHCTIALPKIPTNISASNCEVYNGTSWQTLTLQRFKMTGSLCILKWTTSPDIAVGVYGMQGTINLTY